MSTWISTISTRFAPLLAAVVMALVCWMTHTTILVILGGEPLVEAMFPPLHDVTGRALMALTTGAVAATGVQLYSRALRGEIKALSDSDLHYRTVLETTSDSIITVNADARVVAVNAAATRTFGQEAPAFLLLDIDELIPAVDDDLLPDIGRFSELLRTPAGLTGGTVHVTGRGLDGRRFPAEVHVVPASYRDKSHRLLFVRELTEQVRAREALQKSEEEYRGLFEQMIDGVYRCLEDGTVVAANPAIVSMLGYDSAREVCLDVNAVHLCANREQADRIMDMLEEEGESRNVTVDIRRKDGSIMTVVNNTRLLSEIYNGMRVYQGTFTDISKLQATAAALRDSEEHFRALAENSMDIVIVIDDQGEVLYVSPSCHGITGFTPAQLRGEKLFSAIHVEDVEKVREVISRGFASPGTPRSSTCRYMHADGGVRYIETIGTAFRNAAGQLRAVINARDITKRRRTEMQLRQAQKMQAVGQLTGGIAHDFNNLLTVIVGNLEMIEDAGLDPETQVQAETALRAAMRGSDLTQQLLAFARRQPLEPRVTDVNHLILRMEPLLRRSLGQSVRLDFNCGQDVWMAKVDPAQLEAAILNLVINARDAIDGEGSVTISARNSRLKPDDLSDESMAEAGEFICIRVEDTGSGMSEHVRKSAIEPFFSTKEASNGSGLGLSMVYGFVQQSGGQLVLASEEGDGTQVEIYLPRTFDTVPAEDVELTPADAPSGQETVLVVDDNADVCNSAVATIARLGYEVIAATDGEEALSVLANSNVDLLFSDVKMPIMSGFELAARAQAVHPNLKVLLTSGFADTAVPNSSSGEEIYDFVPKPYKREQLAIKIRSILDNDDHERL